MLIYLETDYIVIFYDNANHILVVIIKRKPFSSGELREQANVLIEAMTYFKTGKVVYNITHLGFISTDLASEWFKRAFGIGYSHCACVIPLSNVHTQVLIENIATKAIAAIPTAYFDNIRRGY